MAAPSDPRPVLPYALVLGKGIAGARHGIRRLAGPQGWYGVVVRHRINQRRPIKTFDYCINKFIYSYNHILIFMYCSLRGRSLQAYWLWHGLTRIVLFFCGWAPCILVTLSFQRSCRQKYFIYS